MKILLISHLYPSESFPGKGTFVKELTTALRADHEVRVVSGRYGEDTELHDDPSSSSPVPLPQSAILPGWATVLRAVGPYARSIATEVENWCPDVVSAHFAVPDGLACARALRGTDVPLVVTLHGSDVNRQLTRPYVGGRVAALIAQAAARVTCVSEAMKRDLECISPDLASLATVVSNGYDDEIFAPCGEERGAYYVFVGSLTSVKAVDVLIDAHARALPQTGLRLVLVGSGSQEDSLRSQCESLGVGSSVDFVGSQTRAEVAEWMGRARFLVLPSKSEGMPISAIEALACGTPVIGSNVGGIPEIVTGSQLGSLVPPGDPGRLADAISEAASTEWGYAMIPELAPIRSWNGVAREMTDVFAAAIGDPS